jgi:PEGA domain
MKNGRAITFLMNMLAIGLAGKTLAGQQQPAAPQSSQCVIVKHEGSHAVRNALLFGGVGAVVSKERYQVVDSNVPGLSRGRKMHGDELQARTQGVKVLVIDKMDELQSARGNCPPGAFPPPQEPRREPAASAAPPAIPANTAPPAVPAGATAASQYNSPSATTAQGTTRLSVSSVPAGADIEVDGSFVGNSPSMLELPAGDHTVVLQKSGYKIWQRTVRLTGGEIKLNADLEKAVRRAGDSVR